jgi:DNA-directed RNA polymerase II subunit RPB2
MDETKIREISLKYIESYFNENTLVDHQIDSCNYFYENDIKKIFYDLNPIEYIYKDSDDKDLYKINLYIGGKDSDKIEYHSPMMVEGNKRHLYPNECRLKNITYATTIYYKVDVEYVFLTRKSTIRKTYPEENFYCLGSFPIMLKSKLCLLNKLNKGVCYQLGECRHDYGGYFIIDGKEKVIIPQEKFGDNIIYIRTLNDDKHDFSIEIKSVSEDHSKPKRTMAIRRDIHRGHLLVDIPNVRLPIPLFIVIRALGIISDKDICKCILSDLDDNEKYLELLRPSINDAGTFYTQLACLNYISVFLKHSTVNETHNILTNYLLPHMGEMNYHAKALFLGYMTFELLKTIHGDRPLTDRDNYKFKRVESTGTIMKALFTEYAKIMKQEIHTIVEKEMYYNNSLYLDENLHEQDFNPEKSNILYLVKDHIFNEKYIEQGFKKAFKGDWGAYGHTKRLGVIQDLNRLSYNSFLTHLRKINLEVDSSSKMVGPHLLHGSQYGYLDPVDTPDGANVGLHKHMAIMCNITRAIPNEIIYDFIKNNFDILSLERSSFLQIHNHFRLFINGLWVGIVIQDPIHFKQQFIDFRRRGIIPNTISICIQMNDKYIFIYSDEGRLIRPLIYYEDNQVVIYDKEPIKWSNLVKTKNKVYEIDDQSKERVYLEYMDSSEIEMCYVSMEYKETYKGHTHLEIHPSLMFGIMGNQIIFPENNQLPRNLFGCGQAKQAVSLYHSNFINRIDKMGIVLNYGQKPIVRTQYFNYIHEEQHPYGENVIVAIMCHTSYNVEDAILINESSVKRGLFKTTYYNMYETMDEITIAGKNEKRIDRVLNHELTRDTKPGYNYNKLDENGLIFENTIMDDKTVVIGKVNIINNEVFDSSVLPKKGQLGYVDKTFIYNKDGRKLAKVRIREDRSPAIGDKFCSRCGQKGTIGNLIPEENMPFTKNGLKPDIIVNPHALPSRMTIGQLIETLLAKLCCANGMSANSTAFLNKGPKHENIGKHLNDLGYQSEGNEILYNGLTGEQITSEIFMGPTYYMRLKHMVKDKINYRATGQRDLMTRQTNHGRANDGGLRIGEMERDGVISHGMSAFLKDSMMKRGDDYKMAICNQSGTISIYNKDKKHFYSLLSDGPIEYDMTEQNMNPYLITKYGKEFSVVNIPYSFKLLMQELTTMNVQMRIITSDNVTKLTHGSVYLKPKEQETNDDLFISDNSNENDNSEPNTSMPILNDNSLMEESLPIENLTPESSLIGEQPPTIPQPEQQPPSIPEPPPPQPEQQPPSIPEPPPPSIPPSLSIPQPPIPQPEPPPSNQQPSSENSLTDYNSTEYNSTQESPEQVSTNSSQILRVNKIN